MDTAAEKAATRRERADPLMCTSGGKPINPITGECACCSD